MSYSYSSGPDKASNRATADTTNKTISPNGGFKYINILNEGLTELRIGIDNNSTNGARIIFVPAGGSFSDAISGTVFNYSVASGTTSFLYVLR
jgi:hypothetical protein